MTKKIHPLNRKRFGLKTCLLSAGLLIVFNPCAQADPPESNVPANNRTARPTFPAVFDRETVTRLIETIDQPRNASVLKVGYFLRRSGTGLPVSEGFELLKAAAEKEAVGTRRWYFLQSLYGFAAFRVPSGTIDEGYEAYNRIFAHVKEAPADSRYALRQAIADFVGTVPGKFNDLGLKTDEQTQKALVNAWKAYVVALNAPLPAGSRAPEPEWSAAIEASGARESFVPLVDAIGKDPASAQSFTLLTTAANVLVSNNPTRAIELLMQAKPLLPKVNGKLAVDDAGRFYDTLVDLLKKQKRLEEASALQQEQIILLKD